MENAVLDMILLELQAINKNQQSMEKSLQIFEKKQQSMENSLQAMEKNQQTTEKSLQSMEKSLQSMEKNQRLMANDIKKIKDYIDKGLYVDVERLKSRVEKIEEHLKIS